MERVIIPTISTTPTNNNHLVVKSDCITCQRDIGRPTAERCKLICGHRAMKFKTK